MAQPPIRKPKKKVCLFCQEKISYVDYQDTALLRKVISDPGKIRAPEKQIESIKKARSAREIASLDHAKEVADSLGKLKVTLRTQAGSNGRLFGSVTATTIAEAVKASGGPDLDKRRIEVKNPIK